MNKLISGAIGVEIALRTGVSRVNFPDVVDLRKKRIKHIDVCYGNYMTTTPSGNDVVSDTTVNNLFITLNEANTRNELIRSIPASQLNTQGSRLFIDKIIDFQRSFIDLTAITNPADLANKSVYLVFQS